MINNFQLGEELGKLYQTIYKSNTGQYNHLLALVKISLRELIRVIKYPNNVFPIKYLKIILTKIYFILGSPNLIIPVKYYEKFIETWIDQQLYTIEVKGELIEL